MSKSRLIGSCEITLNTALKRLRILEGDNKKSLEEEFKEWINSIDCKKSYYDVLYLNKIK
tara:strand:- start:196 stop:375 length:180 start_codon:yes stop_codon:yes gene_type:complete